MAISDDSDDSPVAVAEQEPPCSDEPLCSEEEFAQEVRELVADEAPRVFALVEEYGERVDGWIVAWGMAFDDHVEVLCTNSRLRMTLNSVERAQQVFSRHGKIRLVWTDPATDDRPDPAAAEFDIRVHPDGPDDSGVEFGALRAAAEM